MCNISSLQYPNFFIYRLIGWVLGSKPTFQSVSIWRPGNESQRSAIFLSGLVNRHKFCSFIIYVLSTSCSVPEPTSCYFPAVITFSRLNVLHLQLIVLIVIIMVIKITIIVIIITIVIIAPSESVTFTLHLLCQIVITLT